MRSEVRSTTKSHAKFTCILAPPDSLITTRTSLLVLCGKHSSTTSDRIGAYSDRLESGQYNAPVAHPINEGLVELIVAYHHGHPAEQRDTCIDTVKF